LYYSLFKWAIHRFDLDTPGRRAVGHSSASSLAAGSETSEAQSVDGLAAERRAAASLPGASAGLRGLEEAAH
jgi:hypothetical protein